MNAIIPHKDTLFFLADIQRKIISTGAKNSFLYPHYPLFAFFADGTENIRLENIRSMTISCPCAKGNFLVFPIHIELEDGSVETEIKFARTKNGEPEPAVEIPPEIKNAFPKRERTFRSATVIMENNGWQVFDDRWHKCMP